MPGFYMSMSRFAPMQTPRVPVNVFRIERELDHDLKNTPGQNCTDIQYNRRPELRPSPCLDRSLDLPRALSDRLGSPCRRRRRYRAQPATGCDHVGIIATQGRGGPEVVQDGGISF